MEHRTYPELPMEMWGAIGSCLPMRDLVSLSKVNKALYAQFQLDKATVETPEELEAALAAPHLNLIVITGGNLTVSTAPVSGAWIVATSALTVAAGIVYVCTDVDVDVDIKVQGHAHVTAYRRATVDAHNQATVTAHDTVHVNAYNQAHVTAHDGAEIYAYDQSTFTLHDRATVIESR
ncbi:hypothetical protein AB0N09_42345 [Streptomyces erythrochromogenes]|uniref:hypothetical protein n=1 Tax=Streptomyces erythrochromogenes TaxID=285574 RepID=UPI003437797C